MMTAIVEELETERLKPMVSIYKVSHTQINQNNLCSFANTIRELLCVSLLTTCTDAEARKQGVSQVFDFWIENPLECLVELGIRKLFQDLFHHFVCKSYLTHTRGTQPGEQVATRDFFQSE